MRYTYTVPKRKANRYSYRFLGSVFVIISILQFFTLFKGLSKHMMLTMLFATLLFCYGGYLIIASFRKQAFDITYIFSDDGLSVIHRYGKSDYSFDDIDFITMVIADENMIFYVLNIKAGKDLYAIPFTMKKELCETIYEFVNSRLKKEPENE